ncbi:unnamed protein product [Thelazia callipaeda]|uniref:SRCR domain-containing protein n=1 Tax=Thelazia callipaeda TaxID=103827 RepID=A0A0N5CNH3_THECL|nr:unnamed protein product [Thelazia callipaeda]
MPWRIPQYFTYGIEGVRYEVRCEYGVVENFLCVRDLQVRLVSVWSRRLTFLAKVIEFYNQFGGVKVDCFHVSCLDIACGERYIVGRLTFYNCDIRPICAEHGYDFSCLRTRRDRRLYRQINGFLVCDGATVWCDPHWSIYASNTAPLCLNFDSANSSRYVVSTPSCLIAQESCCQLELLSISHDFLWIAKQEITDVGMELSCLSTKSATSGRGVVINYVQAFRTFVESWKRFLP